MSLRLSEGSDAELVTLALSGRQDAYRALLERHREPVFRLVRAVAGESAEAVDITQEAFVAAFAALERYDQDRPFLVWLKRIAVNKCRDWARRRKVRSFFTHAVPLDEVLDLADEAVPSDIQAADRAELARVLAAMANLQGKLRETLALRTVDGLTQAEAAEVLGVSEKTVETRLYRARTRLRELLPEQF